MMNVHWSAKACMTAGILYTPREEMAAKKDSISMVGYKIWYKGAIFNRKMQEKMKNERKKVKKVKNSCVCHLFFVPLSSDMDWDYNL